MFKKMTTAFAALVFSGFAFADQSADQKPGWEFGCKFEAQKVEENTSAQNTVQEVKETELNTWTFDDNAAQIIAAR